MHFTASVCMYLRALEPIESVTARSKEVPTNVCASTCSSTAPLSTTKPVFFYCFPVCVYVFASSGTNWVSHGKIKGSADKCLCKYMFEYCSAINYQACFLFCFPVCVCMCLRAVINWASHGKIKGGADNCLCECVFEYWSANQSPDCSHLLPCMCVCTCKLLQPTMWEQLSMLTGSNKGPRMHFDWRDKSSTCSEYTGWSIKVSTAQQKLLLSEHSTRYNKINTLNNFH